MLKSKIEQKYGISKWLQSLITGTKYPINKRNLSHFGSVIKHWWPIQHWYSKKSRHPWKTDVNNHLDRLFRPRLQGASCIWSSQSRISPSISNLTVHPEQHKIKQESMLSSLIPWRCEAWALNSFMTCNEILIKFPPNSQLKSKQKLER